MGKSKSKLRLANISCHTYSEKEYWIPKYPKKRESKTKQTKSGSSVHVVIELFRNWEVGKIFITICNGHKIGQVDMVSIINTVNGVFLLYNNFSYILKTVFVLFISYSYK